MNVSKRDRTVHLQCDLPWYWALNPFLRWLLSEVKWIRSQFLLDITGEGRVVPVSLEVKQSRSHMVFTVTVCFNSFPPLILQRETNKCRREKKLLMQIMMQQTRAQTTRSQMSVKHQLSTGQNKASAVFVVKHSAPFTSSVTAQLLSADHIAPPTSTTQHKDTWTNSARTSCVVAAAR